MATVSVYVPDDMYKEMKKFPHIKWSRILRESIKRELKVLEEADLRYYSLLKLKESDSVEDLFEL